MSEPLQLLVHEVEVGVADIDTPTEDGVISTRVVVERAKALDRGSGQEREVLLVYGADDAPAIADAIKQAAERAAALP